MTLPTIDIKGKQYVMVKDRILAFNELYKNGCIQTELVSSVDSQTIVVKATVIPDIATPERKFTDYSQAVIGKGMINTTSAMENASTSAVGRALAYMGIGIIEGIASADEMVKAQYEAPSVSTPTPETVEGRSCPKCGSKLIHTTTKNGKEMTKCSTNTWNSVTKQAEGCDFIEWGSPKQEEPPLEDIVDF